VSTLRRQTFYVTQHISQGTKPGQRMGEENVPEPHKKFQEKCTKTKGKGCGARAFLRLICLVLGNG